VAKANSKAGKRILALDLGRARIGVAVSDPLGWTAQPLEIVSARPAEKAVARIRDLVARFDVGVILVGLPRNMDGTEGPQAEWTREFGDRIGQDVEGVEIVYWDERLTTTQSEALLVDAGMRRKKRKSHRDKIAASLLLQSYLEYLRSRREAE